MLPSRSAEMWPDRIRSQFEGSRRRAGISEVVLGMLSMTHCGVDGRYDPVRALDDVLRSRGRLRKRVERGPATVRSGGGKSAVGRIPFSSHRTFDGVLISGMAMRDCGHRKWRNAVPGSETPQKTNVFRDTIPARLGASVVFTDAS